MLCHAEALRFKIVGDRCFTGYSKFYQSLVAPLLPNVFLCFQVMCPMWSILSLEKIYLHSLRAPSLLI